MELPSALHASRLSILKEQGVLPQRHTVATIILLNTMVGQFYPLAADYISAHMM
jgi:hypothetical protein